MHRTHEPLTKWFLAMYLVTNDKRGISALQLKTQIGVTYKTAWYMLTHIRAAMGQRDEMHQPNGIIELVDTYLGGLTVGKKQGRGTDKAKVFAAVSLDERGNPCYAKMQVMQNIKWTAVKKFAQAVFAQNSTIHGDGYRSYIPALVDYAYEHKPYDPDSGLLHWLHIVISKCQGIYHGLPRKNLQTYLDEHRSRFSHCGFGSRLLERLALAVGASVRLS